MDDSSLLPAFLLFEFLSDFIIFFSHDMMKIKQNRILRWMEGWIKFFLHFLLAVSPDQAHGALPWHEKYDGHDSQDDDVDGDRCHYDDYHHHDISHYIFGCWGLPSHCDVYDANATQLHKSSSSSLLYS